MQSGANKIVHRDPSKSKWRQVMKRQSQPGREATTLAKSVVDIAKTENICYISQNLNGEILSKKVQEHVLNHLTSQNIDARVAEDVSEILSNYLKLFAPPESMEIPAKISVAGGGTLTLPMEPRVQYRDRRHAYGEKHSVQMFIQKTWADHSQHHLLYAHWFAKIDNSLLKALRYNAEKNNMSFADLCLENGILCAEHLDSPPPGRGLTESCEIVRRIAYAMKVQQGTEDAKRSSKNNATKMQHGN